MHDTLFPYKLQYFAMKINHMEKYDIDLDVDKPLNFVDGEGYKILLSYRTCGTDRIYISQNFHQNFSVLTNTGEFYPIVFL